MYDIVNKISILNLPKEVYPNIPKFYASFSDDLVTLDELKEKMDYLTSKGIVITKPSQVKIFSLPLDFIKSQVEQAEKFGLLDIFISDPTRITSTELFQRLGYVMSLNESLKDEKGKYKKILFNKKEFDRRYGVEYLTKENDMLNINNEVEQNAVKEQVVETSPISDDLSSEVEKAMNAPVVEPVVENPVKDIEPVETQVEAVVEPVIEAPVKEVTPVASSDPEEINPYVMALSKEQTIRLDDEMLAKFEDLTAHLKNVLITLGYSDEIDGTKSDNLIKLLTSGITEEREILYYTLTYNKNLTNEEKVSIYKAIDNELKLTNNGELSL